jgi:hypothetical protein
VQTVRRVPYGLALRLQDTLFLTYETYYFCFARLRLKEIDDRLERRESFEFALYVRQLHSRPGQT